MTGADGEVKFIDEAVKDEKTIKGEIRDVIRYKKDDWKYVKDAVR